MSVLTTLMVLGAVVLGPELEHCRLGEPVFKNEALGFIPDACGQVFVTKDGGRSWAPTREGKRERSLRSLSVGGTFADGAVVLGGFFDANLLRTVDDGVSWQEVSVPTEAWLQAMVARGVHGWSCGSDGQLIHSADSGRTWVSVKAPTNSDDRCVSLDFLDGRRGWVGGRYGSLWSTENGGQSWTKRSLPPELTSTASHERRLSRVLLVSPMLGFVQGNRGTFRTRDGGATWERIVLPERATRVLASLGSHQVLISSDSAPKTREQRLLDFSEAADGAWRVLGIRGPPSGEQPRMDTIRVSGGQRSAFCSRRAFLSSDEAWTWRELSPLPGDLVFEQFVMVDRDRALVKSSSRYFRSDDAGRTWHETTSALDVMDLALALGERAEDPLSCLSNGTSGTMALTFGVQGCFGGSSHEATLTWRASGGELAVRSDDLRERAATKKQLSASEVRALFEQLRARATRTEHPSGCSSTNVFNATLDVTCTLAAKEQRQTVTVKSSDCGSTNSGSPGAYARAVGLHQWALGL